MLLKYSVLMQNQKQKTPNKKTNKQTKKRKQVNKQTNKQKQQIQNAKSPNRFASAQHTKSIKDHHLITSVH